MPDQPRIAILMEFPSLLGGERSLLSVLDRLKDHFDFFLFAPRSGPLADKISSTGLNHVPFDVRDAQGKRKSDDVLLTELCTLLTNNGCQILHGNSVSMARFIGRHHEHFSQPLTAHLRDIMKLSARATRDISSLDRLIAVSKATARWYQTLGVEHDKIEVIYNGIDIRSFKQESSIASPDLHNELNLQRSVHFAVTIGQIGLRKGLDVLIEAIPEVASLFPDWHFLIVGERYSSKAESKTYFEKMLTCLKQSGVDDRVHWLGYRTDIPGILDQAELLIHPARQEPFGRVLLEAAALGKAIIATDVGGTSEMLSHRESAWLVPPGEPQLLYEACEKLMPDPEIRQMFGSNAQKRISTQFTVEKSAQELASIWEKFL